MQPPRNQPRPHTRERVNTDQWNANRRPPSGRATQRNGPMGTPPKQENWLLKKGYVRRWHVVLLILAVIAFIGVLIVNDSRLRGLNEELALVRKEVTEVNEELADKERELDYAQTDAYIEREARKRFGYMKPGETRYLPDNLVTENDFESVVPPTVTEPPEDYVGG